MGLTKLAKSTRQLMPGKTMRMGVKPGQMTKFLQIVDVHAELGDVISFDPGDVIGKLHAAFVDGIENAEVVAEEESVGNVEVGLSGGAGEIVMTARPLDENAVDQIRARDWCSGCRLATGRAGKRRDRCWERRCRRRRECCRRAD